MNTAVAQASIGVVVVNYNGGKVLNECLDSLQAQSLSPKRIIVVDNASSDGSAEIAEQHDLAVELVRNTNNEGFAAANNKAINMAEDCDWIALLNPDAVASPYWLETLYRATEQNPQHCSFASLQRVANAPDQCDGIGDCYHAFGYGWRIGHNLPVPKDLPDSKEVFASCAAACLIKRSAVKMVGGFDNDYFCYGEDLDLGFRLRLAGERAMFIKAAEVMHHQSAITGLRSPFSIYHGQRNLVWTFFKNMPTPLLVTCMLPHLMLNALATIAYCVRGHHRPVLKAKRDAIKGLPAILEKRRGIQSSPNRISSRDLVQNMEFSVGKLLRRFVNA